MNFAIRIGLLIVFGAVITACQSLSNEECAVADWRIIGEKDGAAGFTPEERYSDHVKSCERADIVPDETLWSAGYQIGLKRFCTPFSGIKHGRAGKPYENQCPPLLDFNFSQGYDLGLKENRKRDEIRDLEASLRVEENSISNIQEKMFAGEIEQAEGKRRIKVKQIQINQMNQEIGGKGVELVQIQQEITDFRIEQAGLANTVAN
ncbi:MAG: DUF2799 domain-containing protein [Pseudomonadota bacterium]